MTKIAALWIPITVAAMVGARTLDKKTHVVDPTWRAPKKAALQKNPLASRPAAAGGGAKLFRDDCAQCHGAHGKGTASAPNLTGFQTQVQSDGELYWKITNGNLDGGMPAWSGLPRLERWQLVLYLRQLAH